MSGIVLTVFCFCFGVPRIVLGDEVLFRVQRKQDRQYTCNVILRRVRANIVAVEKEELLHIP